MSHITLSGVEDHPRIRGEHTSLLTEVVLAAGSSPHTRGALRHGISCPTPRRIIPAYAGSTSARWGRSSSTKDHPRIRGEHRARTIATLLRSRIIPAYAGSTWLG